MSWEGRSRLLDKGCCDAGHEREREREREREKKNKETQIRTRNSSKTSGIIPICRLHFGQNFQNFPSLIVKNGSETKKKGKMDFEMFRFSLILLRFQNLRFRVCCVFGCVLAPSWTGRKILGEILQIYTTKSPTHFCRGARPRIASNIFYGHDAFSDLRSRVLFSFLPPLLATPLPPFLGAFSPCSPPRNLLCSVEQRAQHRSWRGAVSG